MYVRTGANISPPLRKKPDLQSPERNNASAGNPADLPDSSESDPGAGKDRDGTQE